MKTPKLIMGMLLAVVSATFVLAQNTTATLQGTVTDPNGAVIKDAKVTITNTQTGVAQTATTNSEGRYFFVALQPGGYSVSGEAQGFQKLTKQGIRLEISQTATVDLQLPVSGVEQVVEVGAADVLLQTDRPSIEQTVEQKLVESLPLIDQNVMQLVQITPGVVSGNPGNPSPIGLIGNRSFFDSNFSVNGSRASTNEVLVDGVSNTIGDFNGVGLTPPAGSVQEFKVLSGAVSAEFGRSGGGFTSYATRPGGNRYRGSLYEFHQNSELNANGWFNNRNRIARVSNRRNHFGVAFNGPVEIPWLYNGKNKTFFFFNYEGRRNRDPIGQLFTVPTLAQRNGDFSGIKNRNGQDVTIYNPWTTRVQGNTTTRDPFPNNRINCAAINPATNKPFCDPVALAALKFYPEPNRPPDDASGANNYVAAGTNKLDLNYYSIRGDHVFSDKQNVYLRYTRVRREDEQFNPFGNAGSAGRVIVDKFTHAVINHNYTFTPTLTNNFRYGYVRSHANQIPFGTGFDPTTLGLPAYLRDNAAVLQFPTFAITGNGFSYSSLGSRGYNNQPRDTTTIADTVTKIWSGHTIKTGGEYRLIRFFPFQVFDTTGNFSIGTTATQQNPLVSSTTTGWGLASFLLGAYNSATYEYGTPVTIFHHYVGAFIQDDWRLTRNLTLNLGLRWDVETGTQEAHDRLTTFDFRAPSPLAGRAPVPADQIVRDLRPNFQQVNGLLRFVNKGEAEWAADKDRFAPRIGAAYRIGDNMTVRAGYSIYYLPVSVENLGSVGFNYLISTGQPNPLTPEQFLSNPFPAGIPPIIGRSQGANSLLGQSITAVEDRVIDSSYNQVWNLAIQRLIGRDWVAEAAYVGSKGINLPLNSFNLNQLDPSLQKLGNGVLGTNVPNPFFGLITDPNSVLSRPTVSRSQLLRPFPQYTGVTYSRPLANLGDAEYNSLQLKLQKRFTKGLSLLTHYTWSKSMDIGGTGNGIAFTDPTPIQNIYNIRDEWSLSTADVPHRFVANGVYELPFGYKKRFLSDAPRLVDALIGGWQLSGSYTWQRGTPLAITAINRLAIGNATMRASFNPGVNPRYEISQARENVRNNGFWFNTAAFINPNDPKGPTNPNGPATTDSTQFVLGNTSRTLGSVRRDNYINLDFALWKTFRVTERVRFEFRGEFFNALNYVVFGTPVTNVNDSQFGRVTTQLNSPRRIQLAGRVNF
jgi:hypothetical protein